MEMGDASSLKKKNQENTPGYAVLDLNPAEQIVHPTQLFYILHA